jgi:hypothetical protein
MSGIQYGALKMVTLVKDLKVSHDADDVMTHQTHTKERI